MERFNALDFQPHPGAIGGVRAVMEFPNGYAASVVKFYGSYGFEDDLWELAVMDGGGVCYETPITDDVLGYLSDSDVDGVLGRINDLPQAPNPRGETE